MLCTPINYSFKVDTRASINLMEPSPFSLETVSIFRKKVVVVVAQ